MVGRRLPGKADTWRIFGPLKAPDSLGRGDGGKADPCSGVTGHSLTQLGSLKWKKSREMSRGGQMEDLMKLGNT